VNMIDPTGNWGEYIPGCKVDDIVSEKPKNNKKPTQHKSSMSGRESGYVHQSSGGQQSAQTSTSVSTSKLLNNANLPKSRYGKGQDWTYAIGYEFYAQAVIRGSITRQFFYCTNGTYGRLETTGYGGGVMTLGVGANAKVSVFGCSASELEGKSTSIGASGGEGVCFGGEVILDNNHGLVGGSVTAGIGAGLVPFDVNCEMNDTHVTIYGKASSLQEAQRKVQQICPQARIFTETIPMYQYGTGNY